MEQEGSAFQWDTQVVKNARHIKLDSFYLKSSSSSLKSKWKFNNFSISQVKLIQRYLLLFNKKISYSIVHKYLSMDFSKPFPSTPRCWLRNIEQHSYRSSRSTLSTVAPSIRLLTLPQIKPLLESPPMCIPGILLFLWDVLSFLALNPLPSCLHR